MDQDHDGTATEGTTRRRMLGRAGALAAGGMATLAGSGTAAAAGGEHSLRRFKNFTVTQEQFGVTAVTAAIKKAPGTPSEQFLPVRARRSRRNSRTCKRSRPSARGR